MVNKYRSMAIRFAGCLWVYHKVCPQCGNNKGNHMSGCKKTYEKLTNPRDAEEVFVEAFESGEQTV